MAKNENPETPEINRKLSKSKRPSLNALMLLENCWKAIKFLSTYHFVFNNKKSQFQGSIVSASWYFEQHLESFVMNTQNAWESARNQINRINTSKNELLKIFRGFRVFEYALWQKTKTRKCRKSIERSKKHPVLTIYRR